jgi:hypothetical protein
MYRRGFSLNRLRNTARRYAYRVRGGRRAGSPAAWLAGAGCVLLILCLVCVGLAALALIYLFPVRVESLAPLAGWIRF